MRGVPESEDLGRGREIRSYLLGGAVTLGLTLAAFALVWLPMLTPLGTRIALCLLAIIQIAAHFRYFLHIDLRRSHRDDLMLILFTVLIAVLMVGGTIWILFDQWTRMM